MSAHVTLRPRQLALAAVVAASGGFVGTLLRTWLTGLEHLPSPNGSVTWPQEIPWALLAINFVGVYVATYLLAGPLRRRDPNEMSRILIITGFFGGLTSYSGLYVNLAAIWHVCVGGFFAVILGALVSGVLAGWLGLQGRR